MVSAPLLVKVISKTGDLSRQMPRTSCWDGLRFTFDRSADRYDWLVVYDDIPAVRGGKVSWEQLACAREKTILVTHEPAAVKIHGTDFINQFEYVLTCHEEWALRHRNRTAFHPASPWWYRIGGEGKVDYDTLKNTPPWQKTKTLSTLCSTKQQTHTLHRRRYQFTQQLQTLLPQMDWFGVGVRAIQDKAEGMDEYRYHVAVENHCCPHYWTEKLADSFLAYCLPFYYGCPNAADYFPADSFIPIDIDDAEDAARKIQTAIDGGEYEKRLPAIIEARRRVLDEHNFFPGLTRFIKEHAQATDLPTTASNKGGDGVIYSRRALLSKSPVAAVRYLTEKARARLKFFNLNKR